MLFSLLSDNYIGIAHPGGAKNPHNCCPHHPDNFYLFSLKVLPLCLQALPLPTNWSKAQLVTHLQADVQLVQPPQLENHMPAGHVQKCKGY